jgi:glucose-1-phosphate thymidylyltransferase
MNARKGIILAGGLGTRLYPITKSISKHLLPVYDKPMIYYPLSTLMLTGIREIAIITTPDDKDQYKNLLGDGRQWGISLTYIVQEKPEGIAQAYLLANVFLAGAPSTLILGDNIFFGDGLGPLLKKALIVENGATIFCYHVRDPGRYGVVGFDNKQNINQIIEKPNNPPSNYAITGLYFLDGDAPKHAQKIKPSDRNELEITSLLEIYKERNMLNYELMGRGFAWLDTGTHSSLLDAGEFVKTLQERQGLQVGCPEEIAFNLDWIKEAEIVDAIKEYGKNDYGNYLKNLLIKT